MNTEKNNEYEMLTIENTMAETIKNGDADGFVKAQFDLAELMQDKIIKEAKDYIDLSGSDDIVLDNRGKTRLTTEEKKYYNEVIQLGGFEEMHKAMPSTVFERVFDNLKKNHVLLTKVDFKQTSGLTEITYRDETKDGQTAAWGALTSEIVKKLESGFKVVKTEAYKLSAFIPVSKSMLDLGPEWLDRYVTELLEESVALALETAVVAGDGKNQPIGMLANLDGAVTSGSYPMKDATQLANLTPATLGSSIMAPLTKEGTRAVTGAIIVVNPLDYWNKIFAATTMLTADKTYVHGVLPIPAEIITSPAVPEGKMIAGIGTDYLMTLSSDRKLEYSDHYKFLEDQRVYITKQYANGQPKDNSSFLVFDISGLTPTA